MLILYGTAFSRASRALVALEELGLSYEHVPLKPLPGSADRERLLRINRNGHIPVLDDSGFVLWESMAINLYLAERHGRPPFWPADPQARARVFQWSLWSQTEIDRRDWQATRRIADPERKKWARDGKVAALRVLDAALADRAWLLGTDFSVADLNVAATLSEPHEGGKIDWDRLDAFELGLRHLGDWLQRCTMRPSWKKVATLP